MDTMIMMIRVPLAPKSPVFQSASRPYGFSITSFAAPPSAAGAAAGTDAAGAAAEACAEVAGAAAEACSCAITGAATAAVRASTAAARNAEKRFFIMVLPLNKIRLVVLTGTYYFISREMRCTSQVCRQG